jgi:thymidylate synthase ThyX
MILGDIEVGIMTNVTTPQQMFERIEVCGRICYKSQHLIQYDEKGHSTTARDFVERICNVNKHRSIAEHGTVYFIIRIHIQKLEYILTSRIYTLPQITEYYWIMTDSRICSIGDMRKKSIG